jgi:hypothetical protein
MGPILHGRRPMSEGTARALMMLARRMRWMGQPGAVMPVVLADPHDREVLLIMLDQLSPGLSPKISLSGAQMPEMPGSWSP